jgi:hypothetical protein
MPRAAKAIGANAASPGPAASSGRFAGGLSALGVLPALLSVLVLGALGILIPAARRRFVAIVWGQPCQPRSPTGLESLRS